MSNSECQYTKELVGFLAGSLLLCLALIHNNKLATDYSEGVKRDATHHALSLTWKKCGVNHNYPLNNMEKPNEK